ncbi:hypothetical protein FACS189476_11900 [Spirochaetia bacterium]|nr:hypothetical protein FACS189476_11900 [Spirochaetia bacterium]
MKKLSIFLSIISIAIFLASATSCASPPPPNSNGEPAWVVSPDQVYPPGRYIAAVGYGRERGEAEQNALAALVAVFGQSVQAELNTITRYSEAIANGAVTVTEDSAIENAIKTSVAMDTLVGAEIDAVWHDGGALHYAAAIMDRAKTTALYMDMISLNQRTIAELTTLPNAEKFTLGGIARFRLAGTIADLNQVYANVLAVIGSGAGPAGSLRPGNSYRLEAAEIADNIPVAVKVINDRNNRINAALARALNKAGFKSGEAASRYVLAATLTLTEDPAQNQRFVFANYLVDTSLTDTQTGTVLLPFTLSGKEGHTNMAGAEDRALMSAEKQITENYGAALSDWLSSFM